MAIFLFLVVHFVLSQNTLLIFITYHYIRLLFLLQPFNNFIFSWRTINIFINYYHCFLFPQITPVIFLTLFIQIYTSCAKFSWLFMSCGKHEYFYQDISTGTGQLKLALLPWLSIVIVLSKNESLLKHKSLIWFWHLATTCGTLVVLLIELELL